MATTYKTVFKNHCTPQEQIVSGGRWYLDSDCGKKLTGIASTTQTHQDMAYTGSSPITATTTASNAIVSGGDANFVWIKNLESTDLLITIDDSNYLIKLSKDEAFCSGVNSAATIKFKTASGTTKVEYAVGTTL